MTFSLCVREPYTGEDGADQLRFGVAVTTRLPAVGTLCPFANEHGVIATQSLVNVDLGRRGVAYLADGLAIDDVLTALLHADEGSAQRQVHGLDREGSFAFSGEECQPWYGHREEAGYTVAGNLLVGRPVIDETADAYASARHGDAAGPHTDGEDAVPLASRLIDALEAGHAAGGDKREELRVQSAALVVATTEDREMTPYYNDLRVDATETPVADLRTTYELAHEGFADAVQRYQDAYEADDLDAAS